jgi:hypothetical protein
MIRARTRTTITTTSAVCILSEFNHCRFNRVCGDLRVRVMVRAWARAKVMGMVRVRIRGRVRVRVRGRGRFQFER